MIPFAWYIITKTETLNTCCLKNILRSKLYCKYTLSQLS